ncbi:MAG: hypothetical protein WC750_03710 [Patescibacteria group bacterium]|jgi:hypothetical protein
MSKKNGKKGEDYALTKSEDKVRGLIEIYDGMENPAPYRKDRKIWWTGGLDGPITRGGIILIYKFYLRQPVEAVFQLPEGAVVDFVKETETKPEYYVTDLGCRLHFRNGAKPNDGGLVTGSCEISVRRCQPYVPRDGEDWLLNNEQFLDLPESKLKPTGYIDTYNNVSFLGSSKDPDTQLVVANIQVECELEETDKPHRRRGNPDRIKAMVTKARKYGAFWSTNAPDRRRECLLFLFPFNC